MKQLFIGIFAGLLTGLCCVGCSTAKTHLNSEPMQVILTDRNFINTTKVTTDDGVYRIFTIESTDGKGGVGISAVKIK